MKWIVTMAAGVGTLVAGCSTSADGKADLPTAIDTAVVQVDCGETGVANVTVKYGTGPESSTLIGRTGAETIDSFSSRYSLSEDTETAKLEVTVEPNRGTCETTVTDYTSGDVLFERSTAGKAEVTIMVKGSAI